MNVLVDTSIWSLAYRRSEADLNPTEKKLKAELAELIRESRVRVVGPVRQELLSGIRNTARFELIKADLRSFDEERLFISDYEYAAELSNSLRSKGVTGWPTDCLICAVAIDRKMSIFTSDDDFQDFAKHLPLQLHTSR